MNAILLLLQVYLATVLGVSGLAKAVNSKQFAVTLRSQRILPNWSIDWISYLVPWLAMLLALLLVVGVLPIVVGTITLLIFISFLIIEIILLKTKRNQQCGCYGMAHPQKVDEASVTVSIIFVTLAGFNLWGTLSWGIVSSLWRIPVIVSLSIGSIWLSIPTMRDLIQAHRKNVSFKGYYSS